MANDWRNEYITKLTGGANNSTLNNSSGDWRQKALNTIQAEQEKAEKKRKADALMAKASSVLTPDPIYDYTGASKKKTKTPTPQINADKSSVINLGLGPLSSEAVSEGVASGKFKAETDKNGKTTVSNNPNFETPAKKAQIIDATDRISPNAPRKTNWGKLLKGTVKKGLGQSAESLITIPDELLGGFAQEAWYMFGLDKLGEKIWGNDLNPLSALREDVSRNNALDNEYFADAAGTSKFAQKVDEYGTATIAALPQLLAAFMTGGTSLAASATASTETLSRQAAQSVAKGWSQVQGMLGNSARTMLKNPNYQTSFLMEAGNAYNEAVNDGASEAEATLYALTYGAFSAMIEVGGADEALGGIQKLPIQLRDAIEKGEKNGVMMWVKNAVEEGMEEVQQGAIGRAFKGMYGEDVPIYSENDDNAIINPGAMKDDFMGGLVVGGVLSGGTAAVRKGAQGAQTLARNETLRRTFDGYQRNLVEIGLKQPEGSRANELAKEYNTQLNETSNPLSGRQTAKLYDSIMDARENRSEINAINEDVIGQAMDMPEGSRAHTLADSLRTKQLEGEEITSNEMEKLRQAMNEKEEVLPLVSSEEYDTAQKFKADYAQAYDDGLISESAIYDAAISITEGRTEAEAAETIVEEIERSANKKIRDNFRNEIRDGTISGEEINTYSKAVASGMAMDKAIRLADLTIEERIDNEAGKQSTDAGMGRQPDMGAGEQAGRVHEDTGRAEENKRTERSSKGAERKDIPKADRISSKEAGLRNGTDAKNLEVISEERLHPATQRIMKAFSKAANGITAVKGRFETRHGTIQGVTTADGKVIFRTDTAYGQEAILLHECGHLYIRDDSSLKAALKDACTEAMTENELRELSVKYGSLWQGLMNESMTEDEFLDMMLEEIYCDALAGIDRIRARGAGKLTEAVRSVFEQETGIDVDALLNDAETAKTEAKTETAKAPAKETRNNGPPKHSVEDLPDGKKYVRADRQVIFGNDPEVWSEQLENYINGKIRRGQDVQLTNEDGDVLTLTKDTAGKVSSRYKDGRTMSDEAFERKVSAGAHIDELAQVSTRGKKITADTDGRHGNMASGGWNYRTAYFRDFDGTYYRCIISVSIGKNGNAVYNIGEMEERSFPTARKALSGSSAKSGALGRETSFESSIRNLDDDVKSQYSIDDDLPINLQLVLNGDFESRNNEVHIGTTSNFLTNVIGAEALELYMPAEKAYRAMATEEKAIFDGKQTGEGINYHGLDVDGLVNIMKASEEPIAAFADTATPDNKRENRIVLVTDVEAEGGLGVVIEEVDTKARVNGNRIKANKAITVYTKGNVSSAIQEAAADGRILYLDEKRSQAHLAVRKGANYPTAARKADFTDNIRRFWANVKWKKSGKTNFTAQGNTNELPEWKKRLAEFSERYSAEDEGLRVRAEKMSQNTLKERLARVEGLIHGYEMSENLTERAQEELETLRHNREIYKEAIEKKKQKAKNDRADERKAGREAAEKMKASPSAITKSANKFADSVLDTFNVTESRGEVRGFINATLNEWRNRGHFTKQDVISLEDKLLTYGQERVEAEDTAREVRLYAQASHIYVSPRIVAEFGDDWKSFRNKAFGAGIYLSTRNESFRGVDTHYMEFAEAFGEGLFSETTDEKAMLEQIVNMAIDGKDENMSLYDYAKHLNKTEGGGEEFIDFMHNKLVEELKAFSKSAKVEMQVKADSAYQMAKDRAHREKTARDAQQRKIEVEQQKRALKQLQLLKRNSMTAPEDMKKQMEDVLRDINVITISTANAMNYSDKYEATWGDLADMYKWAKANDPNFLPTKELENIVNRVSGKSLDSMTPYEVEQIYKAAVALNTAYYNRNNYIGDELHRSYAEISESVKAEMADAKKPKHRYGKMRSATRDTYNPIQYLESLAGWNPDSVWYKTLSKGLETGERKMRRYQEEANQLLDKFIEENSEWMKKADGQGKDGIWYDVKIPQLIELKMGGKAVFGGEVTVSMTPLQKVMLALESKNTDNLAHMAGGRTFVDKELYMQGKTDEGLKGGTTVRLAPETVKAMVADLTTEEQTLYDILAKYYNEFAKTRINEVSNTLYGYDRATSSFYAPIYTNANYNKTEPGVYDVTAEGVGNMKNRTQGAKNPSYNISAIEAFRRHVSQTSRFVGLAIPIQNFNAVLNRYVGESTIKDVITHEWSKADLDYINDIITELQASTHMEKTELEGAFGKIESGYIGAVFGFNPSVALKVFGSWFTAMGTLNPKYAVKSFGKVNEQVVNKYTAELALRQRGYSTPELAQMQMNRGKINEFIQSNKVTRDVFGGGWMVKADVAVAKNLWGWAEAQIEATTQLKPGTPEQIASGTDPFYKAVAELYEEAIGNTQSMYDVMHRSKLMKADGTIRAFTMFHTDTMQCLNLFYKNIGEARYYKSKAEADPNNKTLQKKLETAQGKVKDTFNAVALCSLEVALVTVLNSMLKRRDKYEDEEGSFSWEAVGADTASNFLKSLTGMLPGIDVGLNALIDALFGDNTYDTQLPGMSMINDLVSTSIDLGKRAAERKLTRADMKDLAVALAKAAGLPVENVEKYLLGVMSWFSPDIAQAYDDLIVPPAKSDLKDLHGDAQERAVYDMLNEYGVDKDTAKEVARLYAAGYTKAMAGDIPEKITVDGEEFDIDPDRYKEALGETLSKLGEVISSSEYKNADDKAKADMLRRVNEFAHATAKADACNEYDPPAWVQGGQDLVDMGKGIMSVATMPYSPKKESSNDGEKDDTRFVKLVKGGVEYNNAADIEETLNNITPSNGKSTRDLDKLIAIAEMPIGEDEKDAAFKVLLSESSYKKYNQAMGTGLLSVQYADFAKALDRINDNSNVSQDEFVQAVDASGISHDAARQMWYARGWKKTSPWG